VALQAKLNAYFEFIESGQIWHSYPAAQGKQLVIDLVTRFPLPPMAQEFLRIASQTALQLKVLVRDKEFKGKLGCD
jgi:hypothetical protein